MLTKGITTYFDYTYIKYKSQTYLIKYGIKYNICRGGSLRPPVIFEQQIIQRCDYGTIYKTGGHGGPPLQHLILIYVGNG